MGNQLSQPQRLQPEGGVLAELPNMVLKDTLGAGRGGAVGGRGWCGVAGRSSSQAAAR